MADLLGIHTPGWHPEERTPMVDGKYYDKKTGELLTATDDTAYLGPPAVDIIITTVYSGSDASNYRSRWARAFPIEDLIWQMAKVFKVYELAVDSVTITPYAIRIILSTVATKDDMIFWADRIANGIWNPEVLYSDFFFKCFCFLAMLL